ncbi:NADH dehydrogenase [ubiquinone] 1 alpha subcomplex subunit 2-like [Daphnia pulex]|uniref:NADH dehydrogenase [ubiquinone] 1 alpha subcomplex subunit 2 n=1 Tax=Daphnia pulex TaxID=6669 RepID=E9GKX7_DAPPU|nr:NADH dehydrogenase [ubiquinone] 1 alpha subcomplex subunit 2-like [Daphnia pulex]XP_046635427.1 NADH dehydrogenase [ubiquinone] 1 alpha subcomplex subunit 2-like [Daphnia pulicaria]EFX79892.1 hypothetical protein DAPPUDRAFT_304291 [Daphnia pulex]|eukprot:EFX79892.1 hypothetical protein DAPPUDRAFT_304291 [Daphnia pulex]
MAAARAVKILPHVKEIRIHLCQKSDASKGVRDFIEKHYIDLKKTNPKTPILIRECSGILPKICARHEKGLEVSAPVMNLSAEKVHSVLESLVLKK